MFDGRLCCDEIALALQPIVAKYRHLMDPGTLAQLDEGLIHEHEALVRLIDAEIEAILDRPIA